ncbi:uncharacterized protein [Parasteatoda tepidariorum]|uniref:uncharacterized protein isoform X1 n=1 Tax=Parasteatoda tepidariorum TaxID=114398 RepID=UPI001C7289B4|nr:GON-4-like protein [Parasteatoda tepidariorum]
MSENLENSETVSKDNSSGSMDPTISIEQVTPQKGLKRKRQDVTPNSKTKSLSDVSDTSPKTPDPTLAPPDKPCSTRKRVHLDPEELHSVLGGMEEEIDDALEKAALKNNLSRMNVKNILKHVITNEYVLAMVRNTMKIESGEKGLEDAVFEPKLTRSKAKELKQIIPWPVPSPMKKGDEVTQLLEKEFLEESSDDEDYKPNEEEEHSDDDDTMASPRTSDLFSPRTPVTEISSPAPEAPAPIEKVLEHYAEDENALVIELPDLNSSCEISEADKIALRTRSKLKLTDTPLEELEASFFAPDITVDMYDTTCDDEDWKKFLADLSRPIDNKVVAEDVEEANDVEDPDDDPEFLVQEEESPDPLDLTYDQTTKISRAELNALWSEIIEYAQQEYMDLEDEEEEDKNSSQIFESAFTGASDVCLEPRSEWMNSDEKLQLDEQMRMYIQLLSQAYLLSHGSPDLQNLNNAIKLFMGEIQMFASRKNGGSGRSAFNAHNLDGALKIIEKFEKSDIALIPQHKISNPKCIPVPINAKRTIATSKVFIYPELLPTFGFCKPYVVRKAQFCAAEDNLIAIGLEQFSSCDSTMDMIHKWILPNKTVSQLKIRIKACKSPKMSIENPVKYFLEHKVAPPYQRIVRIFDPDNIKIPAEYPLEVLPKWMVYYNRIATGHPMFVQPPLIAPAPSKEQCSASSHSTAPVSSTQPSLPPLPPVAAVRPIFRKVPEKRKSRLILPHGAVFSPLKQITPFLKKYSPYPKRTITVLPFTLPNTSKPKCDHILNKTSTNCLIVPTSDLAPTLRTLKPKPVIQTGNSASSSSEAQASDSHASSKSLLEQTRKVNENSGTQTSGNCNSDLNSSELEKNVEMTDQAKNSLFKKAISTTQQSESESLPDHSLDPLAKSPLSSGLDSHQELNKKPESPTKLTKPGSELSVAATEMDIDETLEEDEHDSSAVAAVVSKKQTISKKRNRIQKDLESSLALLKPAMVSNDPKKEEREILYVNSYLLRAAETLKNEPETWNLFLMSICKYQNSSTFPVKLYLDLKVILKNYPALLDDFVAFLKPAEAKLVGKFKQFLMLTKIRDFLRKVEVHFSNQPHNIPRIVRALSQFRQQSYVTSSEALSGLLPLLRNQTHLVEELTQLIPDAAPPVYLQTDFEDVAFPNSDEDISSNGSCENITIPDTPDPYGGKECPCNCHSDSLDNRMLNRSRHCVKCGVKFMDGRIYLQTGKVLKPAQVTYRVLPPEFNGKEAKNSQKDSLKSTLSHEMILKVLTHSETAAKLEAAALRKDITRVGNVTSKPVTHNTSESVPTCSKLPCDVIEDTVFPTVANTAAKSAPSDFSLLRDIIGFSKESTSLQADAEDKQLSTQKKKWSGDEDKLIIYNCQRLGIRKETFSVTAKSLKDRTAEEVEERFLLMVELMSKNTKNQAV